MLLDRPAVDKVFIHIAAIGRLQEAEIESERGDILETVFESDERKLKSVNGTVRVRGRDSNPDNVVQSHVSYR